MIQIDKNIPIPPPKAIQNHQNYNFKGLAVGQSTFIPGGRIEHRPRFSSTIAFTQKAYKMKFTREYVTKPEAGTRVTRVA